MSVQVKGSGTIGGLDEGLVVSGIVTSSTQINVGSNIKLGNAGVVTATSFVGSGANLTGLTIPGGGTNLDLLDSSGTGNGRIRLGASQDLQIYHDGSHSWFKNTTGRLLLQTDGDQIQLRGNTIVAFNGAASTEYLRITSTGAVVSGDLTVSGGSNGDAKLIIEADTDNNQEADNPSLIFKQDGGIEVSAIGHGLLSGDQNGLVLANSCTNGYMIFATGSTNGHTNATERLRIRDNGNIGIGNRTSSPDNLLHVHTSSGDAVIHVEAAADPKLRLRAHSGESIVQFADASSSNVGEINYVHSGDYLKFHVNGSEKMRIDSGGNVTKPGNCCFQAVVNSSTHPTSGNYIVYGSVDVNIGNDYNSSNGIFTAPVAGTYLFHISAIAHNNSATVYRYYLRINNSNTGSGNDAHLRLDRANNGAGAAYGPNASYTYYKYMNVNDTARVWWHKDSGSGTTYSQADYVKFSGHLVG